LETVGVLGLGRPLDCIMLFTLNTYGWHEGTLLMDEVTASLDVLGLKGFYVV